MKHISARETYFKIVFGALLVLTTAQAFADTPPPRAVNSVLYDAAGNAIGSNLNGSSRGLNVHLIDTTIPISAAALPLPTGAATETSLLGVSTNLVSIFNKMPTLVSGNVPVAVQGSVAVTGSFFQATQPISGSVSVSNFPGTQPVSGTVAVSSLPSIPSGANNIGTVNINGTVPVSGTITTSSSANGNTGSAVPTQATQVAGSDGTSLRAVKVSSAGVVSVDGSAVTQPVSGSVTANLGTLNGAATAAAQTTAQTSLTSIDNKTPALGQALAAASQPVVLPATQITALTPPSTVSVTQATGSNLHAVIDSGSVTTSGTATVSQATGTNLHTVVDSGSVTATISGTPNVAVTSSALPTGAATSALQTTGNNSLSTIATNTTGAATAANQTTGNASLGSIDGKTPALGQALAAASVPVVLPSAQITALTPLPSVAISSSTLPTGASTSANQSTEITSLQSIDGKLPAQVSGRVPVDGSGVSQGVKSTSVDLTTTSAAALNADILPSTVVSDYSSVLVSFTGTWSGTITFQGSNSPTCDFSDVQSVLGVNTNSANNLGTPTLTQNGAYVIQKQMRCLRIRFTAYSSGTASGFATGTALGGATVGQISIPALTVGAPGSVTFFGSTTKTSTGQLGTLSASVISQGYGVNVTAVSGTNPTMDLYLEESFDGGSTWRTFWSFERITANGFYESPPSKASSANVRVSYTIGGTTPSFTFTFMGVRTSATFPLFKRLFDRTLVTTATTTPGQWFRVDGCKNITYGVALNAAGFAPAFDLQLSEDALVGYSAGSVITFGVGDLEKAATVTASAKWARVVTSTAAASSALNYAFIRCLGD